MTGRITPTDALYIGLVLGRLGARALEDILAERSHAARRRERSVSHAGVHAEALERRVLRVVASEWFVTVPDIIGRSHQPHLVDARHVAMWLLREHTDESLTSIGRAFGGRDHSTVINALERVRLRRESDHLYRVLLDELLVETAPRTPLRQVVEAVA